jgi:hypothetical protein
MLKTLNMKKRLTTIFIALFAVAGLSAQERGFNLEREFRSDQKRRLVNRGFNNFSYVTQKMVDPVSGMERSSIWGAAFTKGRTYTLHNRPMGGMVYIGLDAIWFDVNYGQYKLGPGLKLHQLDLAMGLGPSVHLLPVGKLGIHTWFRFHPGYGAYTDCNFETVKGSYTSTFVTGGAVSWSAIALGVEGRWGAGKYEILAGDDTGGGSLRERLETSGMRAFISLRF